MDQELEFVLRVLGHSAGSHVMARANVSGRTGRYEETLTADLTDLIGIYARGCNAYLQHVGAQALVTVRVWDLHKAAEKAVGADFVIVLRGAFHEPSGWRQVRKAVLVQAKRQDWGNPRYAASTNHVKKAKAMLARRKSLADCFFAYYHDETVLPAARASAPWIGGSSVRGSFAGPPALWFATAKHGGGSFFKSHPSMSGKPAFIERSGYRPIAAAAAGVSVAPAEWAWGVGIGPAGHFINAKGRTLKTALPSPKDLVSQGTPIDEWLVALADCQAGTQIKTDAELRAILADAVAGGDDEELTTFTPSCVISLGVASGASRQALRDMLPNWHPEVDAVEVVAETEAQEEDESPERPQ